MAYEITIKHFDPHGATEPEMFVSLRTDRDLADAFHHYITVMAVMSGYLEEEACVDVVDQ